MRKITKHAAALLFIAALLIYGSVYVSAISQKKDWLFELKDLEGNREAMSGVTFHGKISDGYLQTSFAMQPDGAVSSKTEIFPVPQQPSPYRYISGGSKLIDGFYYEIHGSGSYEVIERSLKNSYRKIGNGYIFPEIRNIKPEPNQVTYSNSLEYGLAKVEDKLYFIVPTTDQYTGTNAIYELRDGEEPRPIVTIDLEQNKDNHAPSLQVLGLESVGDKLVLIIAEGDRLLAKGYDSRTGKPIGEASVGRFHMNGWHTDGTPEEADVNGHSEPYTVFHDLKENKLILNFRASTNDPHAMNRTMVTFDVSEQITLVDEVRHVFKDGNGSYYFDPTTIAYKNGKLYVAMIFSEQGELTYDITLPKHLYVYVFQSSSLLYKGELATNVNDDLIRTIHMPDKENNNYSMQENRYYDQLAFE
ncbi:hypothetical protein [Paenibacillus radicis (ex Gao et al. 2016)]|uniref:Uncharacterized protein n=1 Tax=Paenibacillus radicis (ex Gao et al. 2016) TaxID=1737354 RepID=A0A917LSY0_9BACL|nr:hypothetical protein [Paenibacillus radicis (ex Gao et al. 2016)]GGG54902.1 hypothetical protein GCM10010918_04690 [Paenibacillus radicis (ex Gao et al. 2016)]